MLCHCDFRVGGSGGVRMLCSWVGSGLLSMEEDCASQLEATSPAAVKYAAPLSVGGSFGGVRVCYPKIELRSSWRA